MSSKEPRAWIESPRASSQQCVGIQNSDQRYNVLDGKWKSFTNRNDGLSVIKVVLTSKKRMLCKKRTILKKTT
jgi:hypothetical protein